MASTDGDATPRSETSIVNGDGRQAVLTEPALTPGTGRAADEEIARFYEKHRDTVHRFLVGVYRCPAHDAEDIIQDTIMAIRMRYWPTVRTRDKPVAYWFKMAAREYVRRSRFQAARFVGGDPSERLLGVADPADQFAAADLREVLNAAFAELPAGQQQVLWLRVIADFSEAGTAEILGISIGSVKAQLHHARKRMRERLRNDSATGRLIRSCEL
jgi:RNA polymerase sigma factor (sigma-70 family)